MRLLTKVRHIVRTHGAAALFQRAGSRLRRNLRVRAELRDQQRAWQALISRAKTGPVFFPRHAEPLVSIIVPVYNNVTLTAMCLNAVLRELDSLPCEVIVVDDASTDGTEDYLDSCSGIRVIRHVQNQGFVQSANDGAHAARGLYLYFLNNDTIVTPGWMAPLLRAFEADERIAAVGSQLRSPNGKISEAGGIIWRDGTGTNYGRGRAPSDPGVSFPRDVDYCSGASLMVRAKAFRDLGGFSREYCPAYYEDVDLCFQLRDAGYRVVYQPDSIVLHFEGATSGKQPAENTKRYQLANRHVFVNKWQAKLTKYYPYDEQLVERAARRIAGTRTILVMDSFIPFHDRSAGAHRMFELMRMMLSLGWHVMFLSDDGGTYEPYTSRARRAGIEVLPHHGDAEQTIRSLSVPVDVAWISRPDVLQKYLPVLRTATAASIIYDTVDLHFLRLQREAQITGQTTDWEAMREIELALARRVDHTVVASGAECALLRGCGIETSVIPIIETPVQIQAAYSARADLLFVGNYTHAPNVDAATWLVNDIMPLIWDRMPGVRLVLAGSDPTPAVQRLAGERVAVTGYVPQLRSVFEQARVFVAPLRFGAGMKGKVVQSIAFGLPVVATPIGAEGIGLVDGESALIRGDGASLAHAVMELYNNEALWNRVRERALQEAQKFSPENVKGMLEEALRVALEHQVHHIGVDIGLSAHPA